MRIQALIIDDELHSRELLSGYLIKYCPDIQVMDNAGSVEEAYEKILNIKPQLIFLDIALLNKNAFELLEKFREINFEIIFVTAYNDFAIKAIKFSAVDYLLKPIDIEQLVNAVQKALEHIEDKQTIRHFKFLSENIRQKDPIRKIALPTLEGFIFVEIDSIIRCEADGSYTKFFFHARKPILVSKGLKEYEELLEGHHFTRVHHSHLINLKHVSEYHKGKSSHILMDDQSTVEVSVRKRDEFLEQLEKLKG
jgi:two-component system LytT family response regulator